MPLLPRPQLRQKAVALAARGLRPGEISKRLSELYAADIGYQVIAYYIRAARGKTNVTR